MAGVKKVAIVGGGIAGLSAAYYLHGQTGADGSRYVCAVFEKQDRLGGNGLTAYFKTPYQKPFADLGVNDFNLGMYLRMGRMLGVLDSAGLAVPSAQLNNSACFFTSRQDTIQKPIAFTSEDLRPGAPYPAGTIYADLQRFEKMALDVITRPEYATLTVDEFLKKGDASGPFTREFRDYFILPRINAMYFMGETVPQDMPIRGVMSYYSFQEGIGSPRPADRRYFERGCDQWFLQLATYLERRGVLLQTRTAPTVERRQGRLFVNLPNGPSVEFDHVITAVPADQVADVVRSGLPDGMASLLAQFRYINSIAVAHDWPEVMPPNRDQWRTYNVRIQPQGARMLRPYNMSYVETMHQGGTTPTDDFVTEDPHVPIPEDRIRSMLDPVAKTWRPAVAYFRHNTITLESMRAQAELTHAQGINNLWYTGGWAHGAGLHEEILVVAEEIAARMLGRVQGPLHTYSAQDPAYVPLYVREAFSAEPPLASSAFPIPQDEVRFEL